MRIDFCGPTYNGRSNNIDPSRCVNFFIEPGTQDMRSKALIGRHGCKTMFTLPQGPVRLLYNFGGRLFIVAGNGLYEITGEWTYVLRGTLAHSSGMISAADNGQSAQGVGGDQLLLLDNSQGYIFNIVTNSITPIISGGFPGGTTCAFQDGYFIVAGGSMKYVVSALYDGLTWPGLAFAAVEGTSDIVQHAISLSEQVYFVKEIATEVHYNTGVPTSQGSPFARVSGAVIDVGTPAPASVARVPGGVMFLANRRGVDFGDLLGVVMLSGYTPQVISPPNINYAISQMTSTSDATAYCFVDAGHTFYVLTFPTDQKTFVYDFMSQMWFEWATWSAQQPLGGRHLSTMATNWRGYTLIGSYRSDGSVLAMSTDYYDDDGVEIVAYRTAKVLIDPDDKDRLFIEKLRIDMEVGVGDGSTTNTGSPVVSLAWSHDGGRTWSNLYQGSIGKLGEYDTQVVWRRLGYARERVFKLIVSDAVKRVITGAWINEVTK